MHAKRDFAMFEKAFRENHVLSEKITRMYARELYKCGDEEDFLRAADYFSLHYEAHADAESACILAHAARIQNSVDDFFSICLKDMCSSSCSEICYEIGQYYRERQNPQEASLWFYNAAFETQPVLDIEISGKKHCFNWRNVTVRWQKMNSVIHALPGIFSPVLRNMNNRHRRGNCRKNYNLRKNHL